MNQQLVARVLAAAKPPPLLKRYCHSGAKEVDLGGYNAGKGDRRHDIWHLAEDGL